MLAPENQCSLDEKHPVLRVGDAEGAPDNVVRTVTENSRTLKFQSNSGFETE
jgi:hypothetical protein